MKPISVELIRLHPERDSDLPLPKIQTEGSAGLDIIAALSEPLELAAGGRALIPTGIAIALPLGYEGQIRPRSGLALRFGVTVLNAPGTIDSDYRGELKVLLINHGAESHIVERGDRIAQLVVAPCLAVELVEKSEFSSDTARGAQGFGHTGGLAREA